MTVIIKGNDVRLKQEQRIQEKFKDLSFHIIIEKFGMNI
jgi:hypothetical protein